MMAHNQGGNYHPRVRSSGLAVVRWIAGVAAIVLFMFAPAASCAGSWFLALVAVVAGFLSVLVWAGAWKRLSLRDLREAKHRREPQGRDGNDWQT